MKMLKIAFSLLVILIFSREHAPRSPTLLSPSVITDLALSLPSGVGRVGCTQAMPYPFQSGFIPTVIFYYVISHLKSLDELNVLHSSLFHCRELAF